MKAIRILAITLALLALALNTSGGVLDSYRGNGVFELTKRHAWHDANFLMLAAIFIIHFD